MGFSLCKKGEVYREIKTGKKRVMTNSSMIIQPDLMEKICDKPHEDGDYSYLCANQYCRCHQ